MALPGWGDRLCKKLELWTLSNVECLSIPKSDGLEVNLFCFDFPFSIIFFQICRHSCREPCRDEMLAGLEGELGSK